MKWWIDFFSMKWLTEVNRITFFVLLATVLSCSTAKRHHVVESGQAPVIRVVDTDFSKGRLGLEHEIGLGDLEKFHGHLCDGLVVGFFGIREGLKELYPNGIIDRTNTRIVSKSSPCLTDVAVYVTGGRYQFNSFYVNNDIEDAFYIIQRKDNGEAVAVNLRKGVKPKEIGVLGAKAVKGELPACDLDRLKSLEDAFAQYLLSTDPKKNFKVRRLDHFDWAPVLKNDYLKTDILNKNKSKCNQSSKS